MKKFIGCFGLSILLPSHQYHFFVAVSMLLPEVLPVAICLLFLSSVQLDIKRCFSSFLLLVWCVIKKEQWCWVASPWLTLTLGQHCKTLVYSCLGQGFVDSAHLKVQLKTLHYHIYCSHWTCSYYLFVLNCQRGNHCFFWFLSEDDECKKAVVWKQTFRKDV